MIKNFFKNHKQLFLVFVFILAGVGLVTNPVFASVGSVMGSIMATLLGLIITGLTKIMALLIQVFVFLAQYNDFIRALPVRRGWLIARDISNMFFVLILLIISFATILKIEAYDYKKHLPKLLLMAIIVNFSKTICGLFIDFSQVVMLTFVNGFKGIGEGSLIHMMGLKEIFTLQQRGNVDFATLVGAYVLGLLYVIVGIVVLIALTISLAMRMIFLWIYVILSPFAFLLAALPGGKQYSSQWWSKFTKELISGPVLAFFVWLSFAAVTSTSSGSEVLNMDKDQLTASSSAPQAGGSNSGISEAAKPDVLIRFIVSIGMLVGGLTLAQSIGGSGGQMAGKGIGALQKGQKGIQNYGSKKVKGAAKTAGQYGSLAREGVSAKTGLELSGKKRRANRAAKMQGRLDKAGAKKQESFINKAKKGGVRGNLALISSGGGKSFQALRLGEAKNTKKKYKAQQKLVEANEKIGEYKDTNSVVEEAINNSKEGKEYKKNRDKHNKADENIKNIDEEIKTTKNLNLREDLEKKREKEVFRKKDAEEKMNTIGEKIKTTDGKNLSINSIKKYENQKKEAKKELKEVSGKKTFNVSNEKRKIEAKKQREAGEKISHIDNIDELGDELKNSLSSGDKELTKAITSKMAKMGHVDKVTKSFGLSNDRKGMLNFAKLLQKDGKFSKQEALGTVSNMGNLAANNGQYAAMGATVLDNGIYREANQREADIATYKNISNKSMKELVQKDGVSALGSYSGNKKGVGKQEANNWKIDRAQLAMLKTDPKVFTKALMDEKNPVDIKLINHLNSTANLELLENNNDDGSLTEVIDTIKKLVNIRKGGANTTEELIDSINYS